MRMFSIENVLGIVPLPDSQSQKTKSDKPEPKRNIRNEIEYF